MVTRIGTLLLMIAFAGTSSLSALSYIERWQNRTEYGNCEVSEILEGENISTVLLLCMSAPDENKRNAWMRISVSKDETTLLFRPTMPVSYGEDPTFVPQSFEEVDGKFAFKLPEPPTDSVNVRYRIDEEEFKEDAFKPHQHFFYTYVTKKFDRDELSELITEIETAESIEFDIDGEESPAATIKLEESEDAVKDFWERISLLDQQEDTDQKQEK